MGKINLPQPNIETAPIEATENIANITKAIHTEPEITLTEDKLDLIPYRQYFELPIDDFSQDEHIGRLVRYANEKGLHDREDIISEIKKIESRLGVGTLMGSRAKQVAMYLRIQTEYNVIRNIKKAMEK